MFYKLKTHKQDTEYLKEHFFILNKGLNSGKPLEKPCPNCYVCFCNSEEEKNQLYWLMFGLWQGKTFHPQLVGSVIPFIRIGEVKNSLSDAISKMQIQPEKFSKNLSAVRQINEHAQNIAKQLETLAQLKRALIHELLK